jgi:hypothetical protein
MALTRQKQTAARIPKLLASLPPLDALLRGSLLERHTFHPSTLSCATCASGQGHLQWVLNVNYPGAKNRQLTLHPKQVPHVRRQLQNLERVRQVLEQICELNQKALRAERDQLRSADHA